MTRLLTLITSVALLGGCFMTMPQEDVCDDDEAHAATHVTQTSTGAGTNSSAVVDGQGAAVFEAWASGHGTAGTAFSSVQTEDDVMIAIAEAAAGYRASAQALAELQSTHPSVTQDMVESAEGMAIVLEQAIEHAEAGDGLAVGYELKAYAAGLVAQAPSGRGDLGLRAAAIWANDAADAFILAYDEEAVAYMLLLGETFPDDYRELASSALSMEDPELAELYGLDDLELRAELEAMAAGEYHDSMVELFTDPAGTLQHTAMTTFMAAFAPMGSALLTTAGVISVLPAISLPTAWADDCSPEGSKQNCQVGDLRITFCGHTPDSEDKILKLIDKLPTGKNVAKVAVQIMRLTRPVNMYFKCTFEECVDTVCVPFVDSDLEWEEKDEWINIEDPTDEGGEGGCWLPQAWTSRDRLRFQQALNGAGGDCSC